MKHIAGSLAVLAVALSFSYADNGDADLMKKIHQETGTGVVTICRTLQTTTKTSIASLEKNIADNVKNFKMSSTGSLVSFVHTKDETIMKAFVAAKQTAYTEEKKLRAEFADNYSETKDAKLKDQYTTKLIATEQTMYETIKTLVATGDRVRYDTYVKDAMIVVTKNKALRLEIVMKRLDMMMQCGQGKHDAVVKMIDKVMSSDISIAKKQQFLERTNKRMQTMKKKLQKSDLQRNGVAFEASQADTVEMIDDVLESIARAMSELEDKKMTE